MIYRANVDKRNEPGRRSASYKEFAYAGQLLQQSAIEKTQRER
jgi:hypothetical protein